MRGRGALGDRHGDMVIAGAGFGKYISGMQMDGVCKSDGIIPLKLSDL